MIASVLSEAENSLSAGNGGKTVFASKPGEKIVFNESMTAVLEKAFQVSEQTDGAFDLTIAPLSELWNIKVAKRPPEPECILEALSKTGYDKVDLCGSTLVFSMEGSGVDMGAVGKGYTAEILQKKLQENGCQSAVINLGGNIALIGRKGEEAFSIGIRSPFSGGILGLLTVCNISVVTSGGYERYFEYEGVRYHHLLDPKTGYPALSGIESVTVLCTDPVMADILSTALYVSGIEKAGTLFDHFSQNGSGLTGAVYVTESKEIILFGEAKECFTLSEEGYSIIS